MEDPEELSLIVADADRLKLAVTDSLCDPDELNERLVVTDSL